MIRLCSIVLISFSLLASDASAEFYASRPSGESGTVVAAIQIKDKGIYNLVISLRVVRKPEDRGVYKSDGYRNLMDRLLVEWRGIAIQKVLECNEMALTDLKTLKTDIETEIGKLVDQLKNKLLPRKKVEVVFSVSDFFLLEPKDR
jgi:hypothetical protein